MRTDPLRSGVAGLARGLPTKWKPPGEEAKAKFARRRIPNLRYAGPEEVAHATLGLVLPTASNINGVALPVAAGLTIKSS